MVKAITGWETSLSELMKVGERRLNLMRVFNAREGFGRKDDKLPKKFYEALRGTGPTAGVKIDPAEFETALDLYYQINGWTADGVPTPAKLIDLGIEWVGDQLPA
jgi:aldehyde:ferredoxin oxidoreductase